MSAFIRCLVCSLLLCTAASALVQGNYSCTGAPTGEGAKAEFSFGYIRGEHGAPRIFLHHSSLPYSPSH